MAAKQPTRKQPAKSGTAKRTTPTRKAAQPAKRTAAAAEAEAQAVDELDGEIVDGSGLIPISWRGHTFTVPASSDDWDVEVTEAFEGGKAATAIRGLLGEDQWEEFMTERPKNRDLAEMFEQIAEALGFESAGE